jgi:hypothetical protein
MGRLGNHDRGCWRWVGHGRLGVNELALLDKIWNRAPSVYCLVY